MRRQQTRKTEMGLLTWMSLQSGWEARTPVQVRSERLSAATASMDLGGAAAAAKRDPLQFGSLQLGH